MNPNMNVHAYIDGVQSETEHIYDDDFFDGLDAVMNASDNIKTRKCILKLCK
jgi:hypothetical protein